MRASRRLGLSLAELLIALAIVGMVMSAVVGLFVAVFKSVEFHQDISAAKQHAQIALAAMQPFVVNAGLGMPGNPDPGDFQSAFDSSSALAGFSGPVQLAEDGDDPVAGNAGTALWVVYSVPSAWGVTEWSSSAPDYTLAVARASGAADLPVVPNNKDVLASWVTLLGSRSPFLVTAWDMDTGTLTLSGPPDMSVYPFDEVHCVRAAKIFVDDGRLKIDRRDGSGAQPVVEGIVGMRCTYDAAPDTGRVLTVTVLARGSAKYGDELQGPVDGWGDIGGLDRHYRYAAVSKSWRMRN
jgi:hypothetical protein